MKILPSDFGIDILQERVEKTNFPWLISNVIDNETGQPLADGKVSHIIDWCGRKIGLVSITYLLYDLICTKVRYPKEIMKMERHFSTLQRWLEK